MPDPEWLRDHGNPTGEALHRAMAAAVDRVNHGLSVIEKVRRFIIADEPFTIENGQLTPSLKIRRHMIRAVYGERLDALYKRGDLSSQSTIVQLRLRAILRNRSCALTANGSSAQASTGASEAWSE